MKCFIAGGYDDKGAGPIKNPTVTVRKYESYRYEMVAGNIL